MVRSGPFSDPEVHALIADHFVPVALDLGGIWGRWWFIPEGTSNYDPPSAPEEEIAFFQKIYEQEKHPQGVWVATPTGEALTGSYHATTGPMLSMLRGAVAGRDGNHPPQSEDGPDRFRDRMAFWGRMVDESRDALIDYADFDQSEWSALLPDEPRVGQSIAVPRRLLNPIGSRFYSGEMRLAIAPEEIHEAQASLVVTGVEGGEVSATLTGSIKIRGTSQFTDRKRSYDSTLEGLVRWTKGSKEVTSFRVVADGTWQSEYPPEAVPTDSDIYPGAISGKLVLSPPLRLLFLIELVRS